MATQEQQLCSHLCSLLEMNEHECAFLDELYKLLQICNKTRSHFNDSKKRFYKTKYNKIMNKFKENAICMDILYDIGFNKSHDDKKLLCKSSISTLKLLNKTRNILNCMVHNVFSEEGHRFDAELLLHGYARNNSAIIYRDICDIILKMINIDKTKEMIFVFNKENLQKYNDRDNDNKITKYIEKYHKNDDDKYELYSCRMSNDLIFDNVQYLIINTNDKLFNDECKKELKSLLFEYYGVQMTVKQIKKFIKNTALKSFILRPCRPLISKFYLKIINMKFKFDENHQKIKIGDNGKSAMKQKFESGTIRFGPFLHFKDKNEDNLKSYTITFDTKSIGNNSSIGIGFATQIFNNWITNNFGENNSCLIKGNGQFFTTQNIFNCYYHNKNNIFFKEGDDVTVNVDLKNYKGIISTNNNNNKLNKIEIELPTDSQICIVVYLGGSAKKKIMVKNQKFIFNDE